MCSDNVSDLWTFLRLVPVLSFVRGQRRTGLAMDVPVVSKAESFLFGAVPRRFQRVGIKLGDWDSRGVRSGWLVRLDGLSIENSSEWVGACAAGPLSVGQRFAETHYVNHKVAMRHHPEGRYGAEPGSLLELSRGP